MPVIERCFRTPERASIKMKPMCHRLPLYEFAELFIAVGLETMSFNKYFTAQNFNIPLTTLWRKLKEYKPG